MEFLAVNGKHTQMNERIELSVHLKFEATQNWISVKSQQLMNFGYFDLIE